MNKELLKENRAHGNASFPLNAYHMKITGGDMVVDCHWHEELEFLTVTSGQALFQIDTVYYNVRAGEGIFVNSGELHAGYPLGNASCSFKAIVFSDSFLHHGSFDLIQSKYMDPIIKNRLSVKRHITGADEWEKALLQRLNQAMDKVLDCAPAYELIAKSELYAAISLIVLNSEPAPSAQSIRSISCRTEEMKNALKYMQDNFPRKLSSVDISSHLNMSEGHFCRLFKQYFKRTPMEYLNYYRISKAARLLKDTELKILEVAMEVGFDNLSYFIGTFKRFMGSTPSKYRKAE